MSADQNEALTPLWAAFAAHSARVHPLLTLLKAAGGARRGAAIPPPKWPRRSCPPLPDIVVGPALSGNPHSVFPSTLLFLARTRGPSHTSRSCLAPPWPIARLSRQLQRERGGGCACNTCISASICCYCACRAPRDAQLSNWKARGAAPAPAAQSTGLSQVADCPDFLKQARGCWPWCDLLASSPRRRRSLRRSRRLKATTRPLLRTTPCSTGISSGVSGQRGRGRRSLAVHDS